MKEDLFHGILEFLDNEFPLNGKKEDLRRYLNTCDINNNNRRDFERLQQIVDFLKEKKFIEYEQRVIDGHNVQVKFGEIPPQGTEEANFNTVYPMASLTLDGYNYLIKRKIEGEQNQSIIKTNKSVRLTNRFQIWSLILSFFIACSAVVLSYLSYKTNTHTGEQINARNEIDQMKRELKEFRVSKNRLDSLQGSVN